MAHIIDKDGLPDRFPDVMRHPTTIDLCIETVDASLKMASDQQRKHLRSVFGDLSVGAQVEGMFQFTMKTANELAAIFPQDEWPDGFDPVARPSMQVGWLLAGA